MKPLLLFLTIFAASATAQEWLSDKCLLKDLQSGDSVLIYQCHVEKAEQQLRTASGQTITGNLTETSITEKFVIARQDSVWKLRRFTSSMSILPNRKFSGLKIREKEYWQFVSAGHYIIDRRQMLMLEKLQSYGRECTEYDFAISTHTRNQIIIKRGKKFRQLVLPENQVISLLLPSVRTGVGQ